jgi:hypothetical protein
MKNSVIEYWSSGVMGKTMMRSIASILSTPEF